MGGQGCRPWVSHSQSLFLSSTMPMPSHFARALSPMTSSKDVREENPTEYINLDEYGSKDLKGIHLYQGVTEGPEKKRIPQCATLDSPAEVHIPMSKWIPPMIQLRRSVRYNEKVRRSPSQ